MEGEGSEEEAFRREFRRFPMRKDQRVIHADYDAADIGAADEAQVARRQQPLHPAAAVDDDERNLFAVQEMLRAPGIEVVAAPAAAAEIVPANVFIGRKLSGRNAPLYGEAALPSYAEMRAQIREYDEHLRKRYVASKRHTIQVDFHKYFAEIERERRASRARAQGLPATRGEQLRQGVRGLVANLREARR